MTTTEQRLDDAAAVQLLHDTVAIPSVSGGEHEVATFLTTRMRELGYDDAFVDEAGNAVGVLGDGPREIVLLGHIDTVPGHIDVRIEGDPLTGTLHGRGSVDAKGPFVTFVAACARLGRREGFRLVVVGATEEEAPTSKGAHFAKTQYMPEACIIGEPSGVDAVTLGYKGRMLCDVSVTQAIGHSAGQESSGPDKAFAFHRSVMEKVEAFNEGRDRAFDQILPTLLSTETTTDGLHETCKLRLSWRTPLDFDPESFRSDLEALAPPEATLEFHRGETAWRGEKNTPLVRAFLKSMRQNDLKPRFKVKTGTADMNVVGPVWQCPILAYGPGDSSLDHTPVERIELGEYLNAIEVLRGALEDLTPAPAG